MTALELLRDALGRVATIVAELEIGEASVAYAVASDLEFELEVALDELERAA